MFILPKDNTYNDIRRKSLDAWLEEVLENGSYGDQCGAKLAKEYLAYLEGEIAKLEEKNRMKDQFLKQLKDKLRAMK